MKARPNYPAKPESECRFERAFHASNVLEQLRPIIGADRMHKMVADKHNLTRGSYGSVIRTLEDTVYSCFDNIRNVRGDYAKEYSDCRHLNLNVSFKERTEKKLWEYIRILNEEFTFAYVVIRWGKNPRIDTDNAVARKCRIIVHASYSYAKQVEAELAWVENKVVGSYSEVEESPDGIFTARCQYAKMDKHRDWYVHDGYLAWMPHDEGIKVKALGDDRDSAERAARSAARREVLIALR